MEKGKMIRILLVGLLLLGGGCLLAKRESTVRQGYERFNEACELAVQENPEAAVGFFEAAVQTKDASLQARALYNLATFAWMSEAPVPTVIEFYQASLRASPGYREAAVNLELLYSMLEQQQQKQEVPGEGGGDGSNAGTTGDI